MVDNTIKCNELIQAGDVFLIKYTCPICGLGQMESFPLIECPQCKKDFLLYQLNIPRRQRLLVGTKRKKNIPKKIIRILLEISGDACSYCGVKVTYDEKLSANGRGFQIDHIVPLCVGGTNNLENLTISCKPCNTKCGPRLFNSFEAKRDFIRGYDRGVNATTGILERIGGFYSGQSMAELEKEQRAAKTNQPGETK